MYQQMDNHVFHRKIPKTAFPKIAAKVNYPNLSRAVNAAAAHSVPLSNISGKSFMPYYAT
jgi:hypothetical protein